MVILFEIEYSNYRRWGDSNLEYKYSAYLAPATNYTTNDITVLREDRRIWRKRSGIEFVFIQVMTFSLLFLFFNTMVCSITTT
jgi:hypothetical protein